MANGREIRIPVIAELQANTGNVKSFIDQLRSNLSNAKLGDEVSKQIKRSLDKASDAYDKMNFYTSQPLMDSASIKAAEKEFLTAVSHIMKANQKLGDVSFGNLLLDQKDQDWIKEKKEKIEESRSEARSIKRSGASNQTEKYLLRKDATAEEQDILRRAKASGSKTFKETDSMGKNAKNLKNEVAATQKKIEELDSQIAEKQAELEQLQNEANTGERTSTLESTVKREEALRANREKRIAAADKQLEFSDGMARGLKAEGGTFYGKRSSTLSNRLTGFFKQYEGKGEEAGKLSSDVRGGLAGFLQSLGLDKNLAQDSIPNIVAEVMKAVESEDDKKNLDESAITRLAEASQKNLESSSNVAAAKDKESAEKGLAATELYKQKLAAAESRDAKITKLSEDTSDLEEQKAGYVNLTTELNEVAAALQTFQDALTNKVVKDLEDSADQAEKELENFQKAKTEEARGNALDEDSINQLHSQGSDAYGMQKAAMDSQQKAASEADSFKKDMQNAVKQWFSMREIINIVKTGIRQAYQDIQGLDKAMTNIAVVTDFSVSDLWGKINEYMSVAQQYGVTTQGVYEVSQLYYQQGLGEADVMELTTETLKMARIAGMSYKDAADGMTVAIRGFKMEMEDAARVTDVYSKVAAVTASDSQELIEAMSKTASSAANVGSGFEETTSMLAVMIEATREAPSNIGSAMKSIISRYGEMTKGMTVDTEGEDIAFNKVDTALQSVGVSMKDATGQFREFDDVIFELASKWETLDSLSQRYVATVFAGNRQQSRFLALMSNYDRLVEVNEQAKNSEDAGLLQYSKTLDSLETKLNNIKTSFQQFYMDIFNGPVISAGLDFINNIIKGFNKLGKITSILNIGSIIGAVKVIGTLFASSFANAFSQIANAWKGTLAQMTGETQKSGIVAAQGWRGSFGIGTDSTTGKTALTQRGTKIATGAMVTGSLLTMGGSAIASKNQTAGAIMSSAGNALSIGAQLAMINPILGVIGGAVAGLVSLFTSIPSKLEKAQQEAEKAAEKAEEANIKRAEAKDKARSLESGLENIRKLEKKRFDNDEAMQEWIEANNSLSASFPELTVSFDEMGNAIINLQAAEESLRAAREAASQATVAAAEAERQNAINSYNATQTKIENAGTVNLKGAGFNTDELERMFLSKENYEILQENRAFFESNEAYYNPAVQTRNISLSGIVEANEALEKFGLGLLTEEEKATLSRPSGSWQTSMDEKQLIQAFLDRGFERKLLKDSSSILKGLSGYTINGEKADQFSLRYDPLAKQAQATIDSVPQNYNLASEAFDEGDLAKGIFSVLDYFPDLDTLPDLSNLSDLEIVYEVINSILNNLDGVTSRAKLEKLNKLFPFFGFHDDKGSQLSNWQDFMTYAQPLISNKKTGKNYVDSTEEGTIDSYISNAIGQKVNFEEEIKIDSFDALVRSNIKDHLQKEGLTSTSVNTKSEIAFKINELYGLYEKSLATFIDKDVEAFNQLTKDFKNGNVSQENFQLKLGEFLEVDSEIYDLYLQYYQEGFSKFQEKFIKSLQGKGNWDSFFGGEEIEFDEEGNLISELPESLKKYTQQQLEDISSFASSLEDKSNATGLDYSKVITSFTGILNSLEEWLPAEKVQQARDILSQAAADGNFFSISGMQETIQELEDVGIDAEKLGISNIPVIAANLVTEYGALEDKLVSSLEEYEKAMKNASEGMDFSEAKKMAQKLGKDLSDSDVFTFNNGKWYADTALVQEAYQKDAAEQRVAVEKVNERQQQLLAGFSSAKSHENEPGAGQWLASATGKEAAWLFEQYEGAAMAAAGMTETEWNDLGIEGQTVQIQEYLASFNEALLAAYDKQAAYTTAAAIAAAEQAGFERDAAEIRTTKFFGDLGKFEDDIDDNGDVITSAEQKKQAEILRRQRMLSAMQNLASGETDYSEEEFSALAYGLGHESVEAFITATGAETTATGFSLSTASLLDLTTEIKDQYPEVYDALFGPLFANLEEEFNNILDTSRSIGSDIGDGGRMDMRAMEEAFGDTGKAQSMGEFFYKNYLPHVLRWAQSGDEFYQDILKNLIREANPGKTEEEVEQIYQEYISGYIEGINNAEDELADGIAQFVQDRAAGKEVSFSDLINKIKAVDPTSKINEAILENYLENPDNFDFEEYGITPDSSDVQLLKTIGETSHRASQEALSRYFELTLKQIEGTLTVEETIELSQISDQYAGIYNTITDSTLDYIKAVKGALASGEVEFSQVEDSLKDAWASQLDSSAFGFDSELGGAMSEALQASSSKNGLDSKAMGGVLAGLTPYYDANVLGEAVRFNEKGKWNLDFDYLLENFNGRSVRDKAIATKLALRRGSQSDEEADALVDAYVAGDIDATTFRSRVQRMRGLNQGALEQAEELIEAATLPSELIEAEAEYYAITQQRYDSMTSSYRDIMSAAATGEKIDVQAVKELYDSLGVAVDADQLKTAASGNMEHLTNTIFDSLIEGVLKGEITQEQADALWSEVNATIKDSAISALSSGTSGLTSGAEGTLSAAEWNAAQQRYGLTKGTVTLTARGVQLDDEAQLEYASKLYSEAQKSGLGWEAADVIWEQVKGSEGIFESWQSIEEAMQNCIDANGQIKDGYEEQYALLQQMSHSAILDPDDPMFTFMEQDATSGLTKNFDNFVGQIDKVKGALQGLQDSEEMGYNDFYNIVDFLGKSGQWKNVANQLGIGGTSIEDFATTVVSASETIGKVDAKGFAALGIDISTATSAMSEGMNESLKETARSQIKYLSGIEKMLMALQALEAIGDVELGLDITIGVNGGTELTLDKIVEYWEQIKDEGKVDVVQKRVQIRLEKLGDAGLNDLFEGMGLGNDFVKAFFGEDGVNLNDEAERYMADAWGEIVNMIPEDVLSNMTEGQSTYLGQQMFDMLSGFMEFDENTKEYIIKDKKGWIDAFRKWINGEDFSDIPEALNAETQAQINQSLAESGGFEIDGNKIKVKDFNPEEGLTQDLTDEIVAAYRAQGVDVADIEVDAEGYVTVKFVNKATKAYIDGDGGWSQAETDIKNGINSIYNKEFDFNEEVEGTVNVKANIATGTFTVSSGGKDGEFKDAFINGNWNTTKLKEIIEAKMGGPISDLQILGEGEDASFSYKLDIQTPETTALTDIATNVSTIATILSTGLTLTITDEDSQATLDNIQAAYEITKNAIEGNPIKVKTEMDTSTVEEENSGDEQKTVSSTVSVTTDENSISTAIKRLGEVANAQAAIERSINIAVNGGPWNDVITALNAVAAAARSIPSKITTEVESSTDTSGSNSYTGTINSITGPAYADGSIGRLFSGAQLANKTLVGELGPELAVYNGQYHLLGQTGAEFVKLPKNAIVFNHLQTAGILSGQMKDARGLPLEPGSALVTGNVTGPAMAGGGGGIGAALSAVRRAKSVWQGLLNSLSAADLLGGGGGGGGGGGNDLKAHIADLQEWYNLSRKIADVEQRINKLLAERELLTDGHAYLRNLRETQALLEDQVNTQEDLLKFQELQLKRQAEHINNNDLWSKFLHVDENGLLQYNEGNETNGGKGALQVLQEMNEMSGEQQTAYLASIGYTYTDNDGNALEGSELVAKFYEELQKQIDDYDALRDTVSETETALLELEAQINEIEQEIRQNEIDLSQEIYDIIVDAWKENIENLKEQNELIKEANDAYAEGIQKAIDAERQAYEESEAIADREQLQRQLSLLRRSGGSAAEIANLEQQLDDTLKDEYFRNQEKALETIQEANERQVKLMEEQVKLQEEALEYQQENGVIWTKVYEVMQGTDAEILAFMQGHSTSFFEQSFLQQEDMLLDWAKKVGIYNEEKARQHAIEEAKQTFNQAWTTDTGKGLKSVFEGATDAEREKWKREYNEQYAAAILDGKTVEEAIKLAQEELYEHLENYKKKKESEVNNSNNNSNSNNNNNNNSNNNSASGSSSSSGEGKNSSKEETPVKVEKQGVIRYNAWGGRKIIYYPSSEAANASEAVRKLAAAGYTFFKPPIDLHYAKGGRINFTGPAWVDGSKSKPERILSAEQNRILEEGLAMNAGRGNSLKEALSSFASMLDSTIKGTITSITNKEQNSSIIIEPGAVVLNVEQLNDAYDIDELYNDITDRLQNIASRSSGRGVSRR